jgi:hypothetical protein
MQHLRRNTLPSYILTPFFKIVKNFAKEKSDKTVSWADFFGQPFHFLDKKTTGRKKTPRRYEKAEQIIDPRSSYDSAKSKRHRPLQYTWEDRAHYRSTHRCRGRRT